MTTPRPLGSTDAGLRPEVADGGITDRLGLAPGPRRVAAAPSWEAFGQKLAPALGPRGRGTALLRAVVGLARSHGLATVRLDVIETNPGARRLYEREGFIATTTERSPHLGRLFGVSAGTTMVKEVGQGPAVSDWAGRHLSAAADTWRGAGAARGHRRSIERRRQSPRPSSWGD